MENDLDKAIKMSNYFFNAKFLLPSVDTKKYNYMPMIKSTNIIKIGFLASMDYKPNIEGALFGF